MSTALEILIAERDRLDQAIAILGGEITTRTKRRGRPPGSQNAKAVAPETPSKKARNFSPEQRAKQAARMKKYWAAKRREKKAAEKAAKAS